jgi:hypothetical protein
VNLRSKDARGRRRYFLVEPLAPVVTPGRYWAIVPAVKRVVRFGHGVAEFQFKLVTLGPAYGVRLYGYCTLPLKKKARVPAGSKLASWIRLIAAFTGGSPNRLALGAFKDFWFTVQVETVLHNHRQQPLRVSDQYSKVTDIIEIVGKLAELPTDRDPSRHREEETT